MQHFIPLFVPLFYADKRTFLFIYSEKQNIIFS